MSEARHIVALSGGKDSSALALRLAEIEPQDYEFICTPTGNELPDMVEHWIKLGYLLGKPICPVSSGASLQGEIKRQNMLPNHRARWCTRLLKIEPFKAYITSAVPCTVYVGIRSDEVDDRDGVEWEANEGVTRRYPFVEWGWGIEDVTSYLHERGVEVPARTDCAACFFQRLGEWWRLWNERPEVFREAEDLEKHVSNARGKSHTFRSEQRDSWPAALAGLREEFEAGKVPKGANQMDLDLGTTGRKTMCSWCAR